MFLSTKCLLFTALLGFAFTLPTKDIESEEVLSSLLSAVNLNQTANVLATEAVSNATAIPISTGIDEPVDEEDALDEKELKESKRVPKATGEEESGSKTPVVDEPTKEEISEDNQLLENQVLIETNNGDVIGFKQNVLSKEVSTFLGIPYAKPPEGDLRFKRPEIVRPWRRAYKALQWSAICEQSLPANFSLPMKSLTTEMSEDCLYLNIWSPNLDKTKLKPVLLWFHGGFFSFGSAVNEENDGKILAAFGDVVVVTFNYRLSAYGFLDLGTPEAKGNMGLFDQNMALKWVHANIGQFGGDNSAITVFGQGVGAYSIGIHIASSISRDLFKRAIMQGGSPIYLNFVYEAQSNVTEKLAEALGCSNEDGDITTTEPLEALDCIKSQPKRSLREAVGEVVSSYPLAYLPTVGDKIMPVSAIQTFADPTYYYDQQKEIMIGVNNDEGSLYLSYALPEMFDAKKEAKEFTQEEGRKIFDELTDTKWPVPESYRKLSRNADLSNITTQSLYNIFSDNMVTCPVLSYANNFAQIPEKSVYFYKFNHRSSNNPYAKWVGVNAFEEVQFIFGLPLMNQDKYTAEEVELSKRMMNTWTSFAKEGKPMKQMDKEWPKYDPTGDKKFMVINSNSAEVETGIDKDCQIFHIALNYEEE